MRLPGLNGFETFKAIHEMEPKLPVIIMTAFGTTETAIEATKMGAFDYILKPFDFDDLILKVQRLLNHKELALENQALRKEVEEKYNFSNIRLGPFFTGNLAL